jgi:diguanylate cyclase (GGDEF)-like protein/PAS domain S-box-containing protein
MSEQSRTNAELIEETSALLKKIQELEYSEAEHKRTEEAFRKSEGMLRLITENMSDMIRVTDLQGNNLYSSLSHLKGLGYKPEERVGKSVFDIVHPDDVGHVINVFSEGLINKKPATVEYRIKHAEGHYIWLETIGDLLRDDQGEVTAVIQSSRNITDRKRSEEALRESEERYRSLVENASDTVFKTDNTGHFTFVNPATLRITGYKEEEIIGKHYPTFIRSDMRDNAIKFFGRQFVKEIHNTYLEYCLLTKESHEVWLGQNTQLIMGDVHVIGFQAVARDITKRKEVEALLRESENRYRELSIIDDLTRLYNSRHFYQQLKMEIDRVDRYGQPLTILLLDLDDFKAFNDTYGHIEGDQVLSRFGQVVKRCLRQTDSAYRYGGEEFTILLPMTTSGDGAVTAERIRAELKEEIFFPVSGKDVYITVSIGLAQYKSQEDMKAFVNRVDQLMYQAKKNGKDRVCSESY